MAVSTSTRRLCSIRRGDLVATYRKIHLFGFDIGEAAAFHGW